MQKITITQPDDWHLHLRDGALLSETVAATARCFKRAIVMPNLTPPVCTAKQAIDYQQRILEHAPKGSDFEPLVTLYLTDQTTAQDIKAASNANIVAAKLYPAGATTNSDSAVNGIEALYPVFAAMSQVGMLLLVHGEVTDHDVDIFDREKQFIDQHLGPLCEDFPDLKVVFEHITTQDAVAFVNQQSDNVAATITPQHLLFNRNDLLVGGVKPHNYCLPILKRNTHQAALRTVAASGSKKFFLGTDSAPHLKDLKENACGCAGCYSAWGAIELYAQVFDEIGALDKLEGFASHFGADFYGLPRNQSTVTLVKESWTMPDVVNTKTNQKIVPFFAGEKLHWKLQTNN